MVPAVQLSPADDVVQDAVPSRHVGVLVEPVHRIEDQIQGEDLCAHADDDEGERIEQVLQRFLHRMKAADVEPVEFPRGVVNGVKPPQCLCVVGRDMEPVPQKFNHKQHERDLCGKRQRVRPHLRAGKIRCLEIFNQRDPEK